MDFEWSTAKLYNKINSKQSFKFHFCIIQKAISNCAISRLICLRILYHRKPLSIKNTVITYLRLLNLNETRKKFHQYRDRVEAVKLAV